MTVAESDKSPSKLGPQVTQHYRNHVRALEKMLRAAAETAGLEPLPAAAPARWLHTRRAAAARS